MSAVSRLFRNDAEIAEMIKAFCSHKNHSIRLAAFVALSHTELFQDNFSMFTTLLFSDQNNTLRRQVIRSSALKLGRKHTLAINIAGIAENVPPSSVLDFDQLLATEWMAKVRSSQRARKRKQDETEILEKQQEVLVNSPLFHQILRQKPPIWLGEARKRLQPQV